MAFSSSPDNQNDKILNQNIKHDSLQTLLWHFTSQASIFYTALNFIFQFPKEHSTELLTLNSFSNPKV